MSKVSLFVDIKKDRFLIKKKSIYFIDAKKIVLIKNYLKALYNLIYKSL